MKKAILLFIYFGFICSNALWSQGMIIDHRHTKLDPIPVWALLKAADSLHIAYGHTSHGSQIISGMTELENQDTNLIGYKGDYYCWNHYQYPGEDGPCIEIHDQFRPGDLGHKGDTQWAEYTRQYLDYDTVSEEINVVMWSWCGGCSDNTVEGINTYLTTMSQLEEDYPHIKFIYMTGHLDVWNRDTLKRNNLLIRDYCWENDKILYDFADIESYDPNGVYYEYAHDNCNYYNEAGLKLGNWAEEYQLSHEEGVYWYHCNAAHSQPLNGNLKAYAAWWLWSRLAGWDGLVDIAEEPHKQIAEITTIGSTIQVESQEDFSFTIYSNTGQMLMAKSGIQGMNQFRTNLKTGIYIVLLQLENGQSMSQKILLN